MSTPLHLLRARTASTPALISRSISRNPTPKGLVGSARQFASNGRVLVKRAGQSPTIAAIEAYRIGKMRIPTPFHERRSILALPPHQTRLQSTDASTKDTTSASSEPPPPTTESQEQKLEEITKDSEPAKAVDPTESKGKETNTPTEAVKGKGKEPAEKQKTELEKLKEEKDDLMSRLRYLQADLLNAQRIATLEKEKMRDFAITKFATDLLQTVDTLEMALKSAKTLSSSVGSDSSTSSSSTSSSTSSGTSSETSSGTSSGTSSDTSSSDSDAESSTASSTSALPTSAQSSTPPPSAAPSTNLPDSALLQGITLTHRVLLSTLASYGITPFTPTGQEFDPNWHEALFEVPQVVAEKTPTMQGKTIKPGMIMDTFKVGYKIKDRCLRAAQVGVVGES